MNDQPAQNSSTTAYAADWTLLPPPTGTHVIVNGVPYTAEQWQLKQIEEKLDRILALLENQHDR